jgi:fumarate hydratase class II
MMPIIAHNIFEMMQIMINAVQVFTERCVVGLSANQSKAEGWLAHNAIIVTALNPLIGYSAGALLVKEAAARGITISELAMEKARQGALIHVKTKKPLGEEEIGAALSDLRRLTEGGIIGDGVGG